MSKNLQYTKLASSLSCLTRLLIALTAVSSSFMLPSTRRASPEITQQQNHLVIHFRNAQVRSKINAWENYIMWWKRINYYHNASVRSLEWGEVLFITHAHKKKMHSFLICTLWRFSVGAVCAYCVHCAVWVVRRLVYVGQKRWYSTIRTV